MEEERDEGAVDEAAALRRLRPLEPRPLRRWRMHASRTVAHSSAVRPGRRGASGPVFRRKSSSTRRVSLPVMGGRPASRHSAAEGRNGQGGRRGCAASVAEVRQVGGEALVVEPAAVEPGGELAQDASVGGARPRGEVAQAGPTRGRARGGPVAEGSAR